MRASPLATILALGFVVAADAPPAQAADAVRTLKVELTGQEAARFAVENLAGTMRISAGSGPAVEVVATVYGESQELADAVRLERVNQGSGAATLRVRYPYDKISTLQYREPSSDGYDGWSISSSSSYDYDGHRVRVNRGHGTRLHADLEVRVPPARVQARFSNLLGLVEARGISGELGFTVSSADLRLSELDGNLVLEGSSGDIRARDIKGSWKSDFSSGDVDLVGFNGETLSFQTSSGDILLRSVRASRATFETSSGDVSVRDADLAEFTASATSGDVALESVGSALKVVRITTSSGDVRLRLPSDAAFEVDADQSSGDMEVDFSGGTAVHHGETLIGYRHGTGGARIRVQTSSGDLSVSPG